MKFVLVAFLGIAAVVSAAPSSEQMSIEDVIYLDPNTLIEVDARATKGILDQLQCITDAVGEASKQNGLGDPWARVQPTLQDHLNNLKDFPNKSNKILVIICNVKEGLLWYKSLNDYIKEVPSKNPKSAQAILAYVQQKCK